ncbi:HDIG domain-containing protein [archaeon]|nr:HDIG domain-containing protein [archaeon]PJC45635.1 MAG: hydrolase [Candidatus Pacearchaeota archaeon CG_4_9_14_0_2_um_filter_30_8]
MLPISREKAIEILKSQNPEEFDLIHYRMSEAVMKEVANLLGEDTNYFGMLGLLHDVDWTLTKKEVSTHLTLAPEILESLGFDKEFIEIVLSHGYGFEALPELKNKVRTKKIEWALAASETLTGLIYAYALMRNKRVSDMQVKGLKKKFKDKAFAAGCDRDIILEIEKTGLTLDQLFEAGITGITKIKSEIGLE